MDIFSDEKVGTGAFLHVRRLRLRNLRPDGSHSRDWVCDFAERQRGLDAVVLVLWRDASGTVEVLLRDGLRPALAYGRPAARRPLPDPRDYFLFTEVVAGIIEEGEVGLRAIQRRAADEALEEAGYHLDPSAIALLGPPSFPSPGMTAEKYWFAVARIDQRTRQHEHGPPGDGSPMEEGARVRWVALEEALAMYRRGELEDGKSELALRRLAEQLGSRSRIGDGL